MRLRLCASFCLALLIAGCSTTAPVADDGDHAVPSEASTTAGSDDPAADAYREALDVDCQAAGGRLQPLGRMQRVQCVIPYADAGKACSQKSDCSGQCLAAGEVAAGAPATGTCQADASQNFGCRQRIDGGVAQGMLCVD